MSDAYAWLALLCGFIACMVIPAAVAEFYGRSEYRAYQKHLRTKQAWRERVVGLDLTPEGDK